MSDPALLSLHSLYEQLNRITCPASFTNWGQTFTCTPLAVFEPEDENQCRLILELARRERKTVRAVGVGHSPSDLACTSGYMVRTTKLDKVYEVNTEKNYIVAQSGVTLHALHAALADHGLAMSNVGSISDQTLGGIISTSTHGSGVTFKVISSHVLALTLMLADGTRVRCSRNERPDLFMASLCGLGSTGLILSVKLEVEPAFRLKEVWKAVDFDSVLQDVDRLASDSEHVRMWWYPQTKKVRVGSSDRTREPTLLVGNWFWDVICGLHLMQFLLFVSRYIPDLTFFIGRFALWLAGGASVNVDDSHKVFNLDCSFLQHTTEWAIPYSKTQTCLHELRAMFDEEHAKRDGSRVHFPIEIRFSAPDDIWLSPSNGQKTTWIGIIQYKPYGYNVPYRKLFARFEDILIRHGGRPHWAKAHHLRPETLCEMYPRFNDFIRVLEEVDPQGMLRNEYVQRHVFGKKGPEFDDRVFKQHIC